MATAQYILSTLFVVCVLLLNPIESFQQLNANIENALSKLHQNSLIKEQDPCNCGIFLTGQFKRGSNESPKEHPVIMYEQDVYYPCNPTGVKQCKTRCVEMLVKYLVNASAMICASMDRDVYKERAYLFVQNCNSTWINTNLSAGREFCCKDSVSYKCPLVLPMV